MPRQISVQLLPTLFEPDDVVGGIAVVVDILRASTTMSYALSNGAEGVVPCSDIEQAQQLRNNANAGSCLLGGERGGVKIDGFDLSNSPDDYGVDVVAGRTIGFTTTNGTNALLRAAKAETVLVGAFVNFSAVVQKLNASDRPIHIVCAGTDGEITGEDVLFAGALVAAIISKTNDAKLSDAASIAYSHWQTECGDRTIEAVEPALRRAQGGRNLIRLGYEKDITTAATPDTLDVVGIVDSSGVIRASNHG